MAQGINKKKVLKLVKKGHKGYPVASLAWYGADNKTATKLVCGVVLNEGDKEVSAMKKWHSKTEIRKSESILAEVLVFIKENQVKTVSMIDSIIGCPHQEGVDYPTGSHCPECTYWIGRDRFTHIKNH